MKVCRQYRDAFLAALYQEMDAAEQARFQQHLQACPKCAAAFAEFERTLQMTGEKQRPDPGADFWDGYWGRLKARLEKEAAAAAGARQRRRRPAFVPLREWPRMALGATAAAALVAIGIFLGRSYFSPPSGPARLAPATGETMSLQQQAALTERSRNYLERSKVLLLGVLNFEPDPQATAAPDFSFQREYSQRLVQEAAALKDDLQGAENRRLRELVEDLQLVLIQIANLETTHDLPAVDIIKSTVDRRGILLKINLEEMRPAREPRRQTPQSEKSKEKAAI